MLAELKMIHNLLRENLVIVDQLAGAILAGADKIEIQGQVADLAGPRGLRLLQVNCFAYCRFVHGHHGLEDAAMLPRLRAANPSIRPVTDRLEADHRRVSVLLDDVTRAADGLDESTPSRGHLVAALDALREHLLEHLAYEEEALAETLSRLTGW
jgi:hypothetical protein